MECDRYYAHQQHLSYAPESTDRCGSSYSSHFNLWLYINAVSYQKSKPTDQCPFRYHPECGKR